jgi:hypothetical protein
MLGSVSYPILQSPDSPAGVLQIPSGILPEKLLISKLILFKLLDLPNDDGNGPVKPLPSQEVMFNFGMESTIL